MDIDDEIKELLKAKNYEHFSFMIAPDKKVTEQSVKEDLLAFLKSDENDRMSYIHL